MKVPPSGVARHTTTRSLRNRPRNDQDRAPIRSKYFERPEGDEPTGNYSSDNDDTQSENTKAKELVKVNKDKRDEGEATLETKARDNKRKLGIASDIMGKGRKKKAKSNIDQGELGISGGLDAENDIEFGNSMIHPNTIAFLKELGKNNTRPWFAENERLYRTAKQDFDSFIEKLSQRIVGEVDITVPELPLKDLIFRIYRDIRFSNDQTPYKIYFSAAWSRTGRKGPYAHYYLQIQPFGYSMIGGGIWHADAQPLSLLRHAISKRPRQLKQILVTDGIAKDFLGIEGHVNEQTAVDAFVARNSEDALKTAPKGFPKNHPEIALLKLRSFTVGRHLTDDEVSNYRFLQQAVDLLSKIEPLITYLNSIVMPDVNIDTSSEDSEPNV